jgi:YggT family protein
MVILNWIFNLIYVIVIAKVILSFIMPLAGRNPHPILVQVNLLINRVTEPVFAPIRRYTTFSGLDFSPFVVILILIVIRDRLGI